VDGKKPKYPTLPHIPQCSLPLNTIKNTKNPWVCSTDPPLINGNCRCRNPATQVVPQLAERKFANRQELEACWDNRNSLGNHEATGKSVFLLGTFVSILMRIRIHLEIWLEQRVDDCLNEKTSENWTGCELPPSLWFFPWFLMGTHSSDSTNPIYGILLKPLPLILNIPPNETVAEYWVDSFEVPCPKWIEPITTTAVP